MNSRKVVRSMRRTRSILCDDVDRGGIVFCCMVGFPNLQDKPSNVERFLKLHGAIEQN
ncbi:hypothetical protein [Bradyrhizobium sp. STM 3561]|uniref:hypothetical protein n=1 Tax=Bradyrhizobium sp. STM 3561 TaxID=578923 RepID=UPI00388EFCA2